MVDLVLPASCAGCSRSGSALCPACAARCRPAPRRVVPHPAPPHWPPCWAGGSYETAAAAVLRAYKDGDRRDVRPVLAGLLGSALDALLIDHPELAEGAVRGELVVVPVPSSAAARRRRGDDPARALAASALLGLAKGEARLVDVRLGRRVADQAALDRSGRLANLAGAMRVDPRRAAVVRDARCVVLDDVVTSGSTITEAARALRSAGARSVAAATALATPYGLRSVSSGDLRLPRPRPWVGE